MTLQSEEWRIERRGKRCGACGRAFASQEEHYSGIAETGGVFERRDFCLTCWPSRPALFSFWKTRMPLQEQRQLEDIGAMVDFFKKLTEKPSGDPARQKVAYLTALLLARKRRLKIQGSRGGVLRIEKAWDGETIEIADPPITDAELGDLKTQMERLFEIEIGVSDLAR